MSRYVLALALFAAACNPAADKDEGTDDTDDTDSEGTEGTDDTVDPLDPIDEDDLDPILLTPQAKTVAQANNAFAFDVLALTAKDNTENVFFSPFSLFSAFSMVWAGADTTTADELAAALHIDPLAKPTWDADYGPVMQALIRPDAEKICNVTLANQLFGQEGAGFEQPFLDTCEDNYGAPLVEMDFANDPSGSRDAINDWIEDHTNDRIVDLLPEDAISSDTALVLANAILFQGTWLWQFDEADTADLGFTLFDGTTVQTPFMQMELDLPWAAHDGAYLTRLPYGCGDLSMILITADPWEGSGDIRDIEQKIDPAWLTEATATWQVQEGAHLYVPKFTFEQDLDVKATMKGLGVEELWEPGADLSKIHATQPMHASGAHHRAFVAVDEKGTEAAAATTVEIVNDSASFQENFLLDRPFLFLIRDEAAGVVLFAGRVADPRG